MRKGSELRESIEMNPILQKFNAEQWVAEKGFLNSFLEESFVKTPNGIAPGYARRA